jgi:hypothetical protein
MPLGTERVGAIYGAPSSLSLTKKRLNEICDQLDEQESLAEADLRRHPRFPWRSHELTALLRSGAYDIPYKLFCRNISEGGMLLLNATKIERERVLRVRFPTQIGTNRNISVQVCHCREVDNRVYQLGVQFVSEDLGGAMFRDLLESGDFILRSLRPK